MKARLTIVLLLVVSLCASAQSDLFRKQFEAFQHQAADRHSGFRDECNRSYAEFLRKAWESYGSDKVEKPVQEQIPPVRYEELPVVDNAIIIKDTLKSVPVIPFPKMKAPGEKAISSAVPAFKFKFYGEQISVRADKKNLFELPSTSENDVAQAWLELSDSEFDRTFEDLLGIRETHNFCDWAYLQLIYSFAVAFADNEDQASIISAWLLCQSGLKARIARSDKNLCFLFGSDYTIFGACYFTVNGEKFYCMNCDAKNIEIADACKFPDERGLSFAMNCQPSFSEDYSADRVLKSKKYDKVSVTSSVNTNLIKFLASYPDTQYGDNYMTRWALYAETPLNDYSKARLYPKLKTSMEGKSELEAVNILLDFVQTAFKYKYDNEVWGDDRIFFAEETLFYEYCDCEDRAILFSRLVRDLIGLDVALIYYPNHLAAAVKFNSDVQGEYFVTDEGRFTVCDPTYIGAPAGAIMKKVKGEEATLIQLGR